MKYRLKITFFFMVSALWLAGCTYPQPATVISKTNSPLAWIDAPLDGSNLPLGAVEIVTHASAPDQVAAIQLQVDEQVISQKPPDENTGGLALANFVWQTADPGDHLLTVTAQGADGTWGPSNSVVVTIGEEPTEPPDSQPTPTPTEAGTPVEAVTPSPTPTEAAICTNLVGFAGETIPDNTAFASGETFTKTWTLVNEGTCTWGTDYTLVFIGGDQMNGASPSPLPKAVSPGERVNVSVELKAPDNPGTYQGNWKLADGDGAVFGLGDTAGTAFWVRIVVAQPTTIPDTQAPTISVGYAPQGNGAPTEKQEITFTARASDNVGVTLIEIYFSLENAREPTLVGSCANTTICELTAGPYSNGSYVLFAKAYDAVGNQGITQNISVRVYAVIR